MNSVSQIFVTDSPFTLRKHSLLLLIVTHYAKVKNDHFVRPTVELNEKDVNYIQQFGKDTITTTKQ